MSSGPPPAPSQDNRDARRGNIGRVIEGSRNWVRTQFTRTLAIRRSSSHGGSTSARNESSSNEQSIEAEPSPQISPSTTNLPLEVDANATQSAADQTNSDSSAMQNIGSLSRQNRARMLFEKYGVDFKEFQSLVPPEDPNHVPQRVKSRIRMRVRYSCHKCKTVFRHERTCRMCTHYRCDMCPRVTPIKRNKEKSQKRQQVAAVAASTYSTATSAPSVAGSLSPVRIPERSSSRRRDTSHDSGQQPQLPST